MAATVSRRRECTWPSLVHPEKVIRVGLHPKVDSRETPTLLCWRALNRINNQTIICGVHLQMATGEDKSKYTYYSLGQERGRERISCLYASDRPQKGNIPTNIVQCLQLDHVTSRRQSKLYREHYVNNGLTSAKYLYSQNVIGHTGCINAVNFSNTGEELLVSGMAMLHAAPALHLTHVHCRRR